MAQDKYKINGREIWQPDEDVSYTWETTYTSDSTRSQSGKGHFTPMFTVHQYGYSASNVPVSEVAWMLSVISSGEPFTFHLWSSRHGGWEDIKCYVGKGSNCTIGTLEEGRETYSKFAFNATEVDAV